MRVLNSLACAILLLLGVNVAAAPDFPAYSVIDLKAHGVWPVAMNDKGDVVGQACCGRQSAGVQLYTSSEVRDIGLPAGAYASFSPHAINDSGWVVGYADSNPDPVLVNWSPAFHDGVGWTVIDTTSLGETRGYASGINNAGQVIGNTAGDLFVAWLYDRGTLVRLSPAVVSYATDISDIGEVVGYESFPSMAGPPWRYRDGQLTTLDRGNVALALNDAGAILIREGLKSPTYYVYESGVANRVPAVGCSTEYQCLNTATKMNERGDVIGINYTSAWSGGSAATVHGFLYRAGVSTDLGTLGGSRSEAQSLNNRAQVAGWSLDSQGRYRPFVYDDGIILDVADLRGVGAALQLGRANAIQVTINDGPYLLITATDTLAEPDTLEAAYLLTPISPTVTLSASSGAVPVRTSVTLTWSSQNANSCVATGGVAGDGWAGTQPTSGQVTVTSGVAGAVQYAIRCSAGPLASDSAVLVTYAAAPPTVRLTATPSVSRVRAAITLAWTTEGADSCMATGGRPGDGWVGTLATNGYRQVAETTPGVVEYGVKCSAGELSSEAKVSAAFEKKSSGGGHVDVIAVLGLAGLGLRRRRKAQATRSTQQ